MFILTIDQKASRTGSDLIPDALAEFARLAPAHITAGPERTVGDELQLATDDAGTALRIILHATRTQHWSTGVGLGEVETPLPASIRSGRGPAFIHARAAVDRAKSDPTRVAISGGPGATDAEALVRLLIDVRDRRTDKGWQVSDALAEGLSQQEVAQRLRISAAAVSLRARAAGLRVEEQAVPALVRVLAAADAQAGA
ncbi:hypothetical protein ET475_13155 [Microbacterium protaetiae]|uniref:DNA-binding protein n=1 Tax=Microbacterium protaetiae TaxID=2509458 RepID=A0A4P6EH76_9MICO|nr:hypothetical protein [Microbacterium protaetiae]QAY60843.1 hypothetical protein ET475_13155 [Microbacterium protaetiae]